MVGSACHRSRSLFSARIRRTPTEHRPPDRRVGPAVELAPDLAGPKAYEAAALLRGYLKAVRKRRLTVPVWIPGAAARAIRMGANLALDRAWVGAPVRSSSQSWRVRRALRSVPPSVRALESARRRAHLRTPSLLSRALNPQNVQRVAPYGSTVATPVTTRGVKRYRCHGGGPGAGRAERGRERLAGHLNIAASADSLHTLSVKGGSWVPSFYAMDICAAVAALMAVFSLEPVTRRAVAGASERADRKQRSQRQSGRRPLQSDPGVRTAPKALKVFSDAIC